MKKTKLFIILLAFLGLSMSAMYAQSTYVIIGGSGTYLVTKDGTALTQWDFSLQGAIDLIKMYADGENCIIQFGNGTQELNLGGGSSTLITFTGNWGTVTLTGKATTASSATTDGVINFISGRTIDCKAEITASGQCWFFRVASNSTLNVSAGTLSVTNTTGGIVIDNYNSTVNISGGAVLSTRIAIYNNSTGTINITGGTVSAISNTRTIRNASTGSVNISGGTVSATNWNAIENANTGTINISGGTVSAVANVAVVNEYTGKITVSGTAIVKCGNVSENFGTIVLENAGTATDARLEIKGGNVLNTGDRGIAVCNKSTGAIDISGGTVSSNTGWAVRNLSTGALNMNGGTVSSTAEAAIRNSGTGKITISGGKVATTANTAIWNVSTGDVNVSGTAWVTSSYSVANNAAVYNHVGKLTVSGGKVENTSSTGNAIWNNTTGTVDISHGYVFAKDGKAVVKNGEGAVTLSGGILFAQGKTATDVIQGTYNTTSNSNAVVVAWDKAAGTTSYVEGTNTHIINSPSAATAVWAKQGSNNGITATNGSNTGFIPVEGVTVTGVGIDETVLSNITIYPNPTSGELRIRNEELGIRNVEVFDVYGRKQLTVLPSYDLTVFNLDISHLANGIYFLRIHTEQGDMMKKVVKQ